MLNLFHRRSRDERLKEKFDALTKQLRQEMRKIDRDIRIIEREEQRTLDSMKIQGSARTKRSADDVALRILAKEIVRARKQKARLFATNARIKSLLLKIREHLARNKMSSCVQETTQIMRTVQSLANIPQLANTMRDFQRTMLKAGLVEETFDEAIDAIMNEDFIDDEEDEIEKEIQKILFPAQSEEKIAQKVTKKSIPEQVHVEKIVEAATAKTMF